MDMKTNPNGNTDYMSQLSKYFGDFRIGLEMYDPGMYAVRFPKGKLIHFITETRRDDNGGTSVFALNDPKMRCWRKGSTIYHPLQLLTANLLARRFNVGVKLDDGADLLSMESVHVGETSAAIRYVQHSGENALYYRFGVRPKELRFIDELGRAILADDFGQPEGAQVQLHAHNNETRILSELHIFDQAHV
jgi:hypothetical protein